MIACNWCILCKVGFPDFTFIFAHKMSLQADLPQLAGNHGERKYDIWFGILQVIQRAYEWMIFNNRCCHVSSHPAKVVS